MRITFTRHGESQANLLHEISNRGLKHGLTQDGQKQIQALALQLRTQAIKHIYSSPLLRAVESSQILANALGLDVEITDALREFDCGILEGRSDRLAWQGWQSLMDAWLLHDDWQEKIEGGESYLEIQTRFLPFIESLISRFGDSTKHVVCVAHGGLYRVVLPNILQNIDSGFITEHGIPHAAQIVCELRPSGLHCLIWDGIIPL